jgi:protease-4
MMVRKGLAFLGRVWAIFWQGLTFGRRVVANLFFLALIVAILVLIFSDREPPVPATAALVFDPSGAIVEQAAEPLLLDRFYGTVRREQTALHNIIDTIDHAATDDRIQVLVLQLDNFGPVGLSQVQEIGRALARFKAGGKKIIAAGESFDQHRYYLAAHADRLYLHPMGQVWIRGYGVYRSYLKRALDKLQVNLHVYRVGEYKSALEPLIRTDMSEAAREANRAWLQTLWEAYKTDVAHLRDYDASRIEDLVNHLDRHLESVDGDGARLALDNGLVDALKSRDEVRQELIELVGEDSETQTFSQIGYQAYFELIRSRLHDSRSTENYVGVITAQGMIMGGDQPAGRIGAESLSALIRQAREDDQVKALVFRIYSGGGSALASEIIRRELALTREAGKPVVVSMSSVAASGGYWIALGADEIWAEPTTITGSIGIFAAFPTLEDSLGSMGVDSDGVGTTRLADAFDPTRPLNPMAASVMQQSIEHGYRRFIEQVAQSRGMSIEDVRAAARGRVWSGEAAKERNLVDRLGGLKDAVRRVAEMARIEDDYQVMYIERPLTAREALLKKLEQWIGAVRTSSGPAGITAVSMALELDPQIAQLIELMRTGDPYHPYAICLDCDAR